MKKLAMFTVAYFAISMAWAYPWHMIWFHDLYASWGALQREEPIMALGILSILIQGAVIGYLYPYYYKGGNAILEGVKFNLVIGLLIYTVMGFATAAKFEIEPVGAFLIYHTAFQAIQFVLTGAALGWIYRDAREIRHAV